MKKTIFTLTLVLGLSTVLFTSCGTDEGPGTTPTPTTTTKTLDKSKLVDKGWYVEGSSSPRHTFHSDGKHGSLGGSWKWLNDSDSMEIIQTAGDIPAVVYFEFATDTEMSMKTGASGSYRLFKDQTW
jgi:hypothetical protein